MKFVQPPLKILCDGLSTKLINDLSERLRLHFREVKIWDEVIYASDPLNSYHYSDAWAVLDKFGVSVI